MERSQLEGPEEGNTLPNKESYKPDIMVHMERGPEVGESSSNPSNSEQIEIIGLIPPQSLPSDMIISPKKKTNRKWKRSAREGLPQKPPGLISSPLQRVLALGKAGKKNAKSSSSPLGLKQNGRIMTHNEVLVVTTEFSYKNTYTSSSFTTSNGAKTSDELYMNFFLMEDLFGLTATIRDTMSCNDS
ncbi:hypothetical protein LWI29_003168 [Acer saccharum]|uniref:Uncharacterized protein n=1 Tax=Acer saccharum TaxID=4024 RepID=A0AA39TNI9_ACESA|nr:hypothetical protein LWI29_003168 [Acer saccharum]